MKKTAYVILAVAVLTAIAAFPAMAFANAGVHGNYTIDTDACAGCHRTHTAPSAITWQDGLGRTKSALLLSTATEIWEFCYICHDATGQGADTNVEEGVYEGTLYGTTNDGLLGGVFGRYDSVLGYNVDYLGDRVTSNHQYVGGSWAAWGGGLFASTSTVDATGNALGHIGTGEHMQMDCASCHDVHGSSNYRILKDQVYGVTVGGYVGAGADPTPNPWVESCEYNYPIGGFRLHTDYEAAPYNYVPNYTKAMYAKPPAQDPGKGMVGWCAGCHTAYSYYGTQSTYNANDGYGFITRHRHPMNVPLSNFAGPRSLVLTDALPLANDQGTEEGSNVAPFTGSITASTSDWLECLTCHNAHGSSAIMTGYARSASATSPAPNTGPGGVPPATGADGVGSALLKLDNRGVCEGCHNK